MTDGINITLTGGGIGILLGGLLGSFAGVAAGTRQETDNNHEPRSSRSIGGSGFDDALLLRISEMLLEPAQRPLPAVFAMLGRAVPAEAVRTTRVAANSTSQPAFVNATNICSP